MDWRERAEEMLAEYDACCRARPYHNALDVEIAKESCATWALHLATQRSWGEPNDIAEACHQLEPRLKKFKETVVLDILTDDTFQK
jgi:hypothetical protein